MSKYRIILERVLGGGRDWVFSVKNISNIFSLNLEKRKKYIPLKLQVAWL
jgi:hypothetical protein